MALKAIDMQVLIPRSHDVAKIQQLKVQQDISQIQYAGQELQREVIIQQSSVNQLTPMTHNKIKDQSKGSNKGNFGQQHSSQENEEKAENELNGPKHLGNILDIHI